MLAASQDNRSVVVVAGSGWHPGVIGIVAGRLKEKLGRPALVIALDEAGVGKGSGRSITGVDLGAAVLAAKDMGLLVAGGGHGMAAGLTVAPGGVDALADFLDARLAADVARALQRQPQGRLKVGFVSSLAYGLMPRLLEALRGMAPGIEVELFEESSAAQGRAVRECRLDVGFVFLPMEEPELRMRPLFREPLLAMLPARHALAGLPEVALERLHGEPFIMCSRQPRAGFRETVLGLCRSRGFTPRVAHSASSTAAMAELVAAGLGVALVPQSASERQAAGVTYRPLAGAPLVLEVAAVWRADAMTPGLRLLLDQAVEMARRSGDLPGFPRLAVGSSGGLPGRTAVAAGHGDPEGGVPD